MANKKFNIFLLIITFILAALTGGALAYLSTAESVQGSTEVVATQSEEPKAETVVPPVAEPEETPVVVDDRSEPVEEPESVPVATEPEPALNQVSEPVAVEPESPETPEITQEEPPVQTDSEIDSFYWVVLASDESVDEANKLVPELQDAGFITTVVEDNGLYEVRMGPYLSFEEGQSIADSMSQVSIITDEIAVKIELNR